MMKSTTGTNKSGFSLIEMLVSVALFSIVVTTSIGTLLVLVDANAKSQSIQIAINNLSFAVDAMTREIRTGADFYCASTQTSVTSGSLLNSGKRDCANGGNAIAFTDTRTGDRIGYSLEHNGDKIQRRIDGTSGNAWLDMTGGNIIINTFEFVVTSSDNTDDEQPAVTIFIDANVGDATGLGSQFQIQTSVVQRKLDL